MQKRCRTCAQQAQTAGGCCGSGDSRARQAQQFTGAPSHGVCSVNERHLRAEQAHQQRFDQWVVGAAQHEGVDVSGMAAESA